MDSQRYYAHEATILILIVLTIEFKIDLTFVIYKLIYVQLFRNAFNGKEHCWMESTGKWLTPAQT